MERSVYGRPVKLGIAMVLVSVIAYVSLAFLGHVGNRAISICFMAIALLLLMVIPRVTPHHTAEDLDTPTTSSILGNVVTRMTTTYFSVELLAGALFIGKLGGARPLLCFFVQFGILLVFVSSLSYVLNQEMRRAASEDPLSARLGSSVGSDRVRQLRKQAHAVPASALGKEAAVRVREVIAAVDAMREVSYEGTMKVESQIGAIMDQLGAAGVKGDSKEVVECCRLILLLVAQRDSFFEDALEVAREVRKESA